MMMSSILQLPSIIVSSPKPKPKPKPKVPVLKFKPHKSSSSSSVLVRCSSVVSVAPPPPPPPLPGSSMSINNNKPSAAEVSRTIVELSCVGTFSSSPSQDDNTCWPLAVGVRFALDPQGTPILSLKQQQENNNNNNWRSSLNVQLEQCGMRTTQCTIQGTLHTPHDDQEKKKMIQSLWENRFGEKADADFIHILQVERVLQMDNFMEDGVWVTCSDYRLATPDPLRDFAERLVHDINTHNMEDVLRFCNIFVDSHVQVSQAKMVWLDRLGFDIHLHSPQNDVFEVRIPFPREVTNEKAAKSSFNGMSQLAWEVEKNYHPLQGFEKIKHLKKIAAKVK